MGRAVASDRTELGRNPSAVHDHTLNLPQPGTPPVQVDVARPGEHFFVMQTRSVAAYTTGRRPRQVQRAWAFGAVGAETPRGWRPNRSRRGWVPMATLRLP